MKILFAASEAAPFIKTGDWAMWPPPFPRP